MGLKLDFKIGILIPCYNVEKTISLVLENISEDNFNKIDLVLIIDNCSTDLTVKNVKKFINDHPQKGSKIKIIENKKNLGLGGTQKKAYDYWLKNNYTHSMIIHSDLQGRPEELITSFFIKFKQNPTVDIIYASRFHNKSNLDGYSKLRIIVNKIFNLLTLLLTNVNISDSGCGIIFYDNKVLKKINYKDLTNGPQFNPQVNILLGRLKSCKILDMPLDWRDSEVGSTINSIQYCFRLLKMLLKFRKNIFLGKNSFS